MPFRSAYLAVSDELTDTSSPLVRKYSYSNYYCSPRSTLPELNNKQICDDKMPSNKQQADDTEEAKRILERVAQESETVGTSSMRRVANRVKGHMSAHDSDQNDWAELWGTRIGRALGLVFFCWLVVYLTITYVL